jgi:hypothetical protein
MSKLETNTIDTVSGTSTLQVGSTNTSTITLGVSGDTINVPSGVTIANSGTATGFGGDNTPVFYGALASDQTMTRNSTVKITGMTTNEIDTNSAFDGTTFTVPSGEGGNYYLEGTIVYDFETAGDDGFEIFAAIYKNGSTLKGSQFMNISTQDLRHASLDVSGIFNLSAGNTIELYSYSTDSNGGNAKARSNKTSIGGYKLIT